jgi:hypothetical protein
MGEANPKKSGLFDGIEKLIAETLIAETPNQRVEGQLTKNVEQIAGNDVIQVAGDVLVEHIHVHHGVDGDGDGDGDRLHKRRGI